MNKIYPKGFCHKCGFSQVIVVVVEWGKGEYFYQHISMYIKDTFRQEPYISTTTTDQKAHTDPFHIHLVRLKFFHQKVVQASFGMGE